MASKNSHPTDNSDLMSRLQSFLPQLKSANQELLSSTFPVGSSGQVATDPVQIDANLKEDDNSDSDSEDGKEIETNPLIQEIHADVPKNEEKEENIAPTPKTMTDDTNKAPTIQLEFTVGNMSGNPLMKLLANDSNDEDSDCDNNDGNASEASSDPLVTARTNAVVNLLNSSTNSQNSTGKSSQTTEMNGFISDGLVGESAGGKSKEDAGRKRLITEIS